MQPLQERQLLQMNRDSLEKRIQQYYNETKNEDVVIEYGLVLLVRNAMVMDDYSFICKDLICKIFLEGKPNNTKRDFVCISTTTLNTVNGRSYEIDCLRIVRSFRNGHEGFVLKQSVFARLRHRLMTNLMKS